MSGRLLTQEIAWPARELALDGVRVGPTLARVLGLALPSVGVELRLLGEKRERRCVIGYRLGDVHVVGKLYRDPARAARAHRRMRALRTALGAGHGSCVPDALGLVPEFGLALQEWRSGCDLRAVADAREAARAGAAAARWLGTLHGTPPLAGLRQRTLAYDLEWVDAFAAALTQAGGRGATAPGRAREALRVAARALTPAAPVMIHKDFYSAHVLWDGARVSILDFDELSVGDPAFDVGHFLAHLEREASRWPERLEALSAAAHAFRRACPQPCGSGFRARVAFYEGWTALKLAATEARRARPGWRSRAARLLERAARRGGDAVDAGV